jgi:hypothetical protein
VAQTEDLGVLWSQLVCTLQDDPRLLDLVAVDQRASEDLHRVEVVAVESEQRRAVADGGAKIAALELGAGQQADPSRLARAQGEAALEDLDRSVHVVEREVRPGQLHERR